MKARNLTTLLLAALFAASAQAQGTANHEHKGNQKGSQKEEKQGEKPEEKLEHKKDESTKEEKVSGEKGKQDDKVARSSGARPTFERAERALNGGGGKGKQDSRLF